MTQAFRHLIGARSRGRRSDRLAALRVPGRLPRHLSLPVGSDRVVPAHFELDVTGDGVRVAGWNVAP
jgi:hypothetical protein